MPHIIVEHSKNISLKQEFLHEIQKIMHEHKEGNFDLEACKARFIKFDEYLVGSKNQKDSAFLHISIKIMAGRAPMVKKEVAEKISAFAQSEIKKHGAKVARTDLSVDVIDMCRESYQKITI